MVTAASSRRLARALVAVAVVGTTATLGGTAFADPATDPSPAPTNASDALVADPSPVPEAQPTIGSWIIGGTLLEGSGTAAKPVAKPVVVRPVARPAAQPAAAPVVRTVRTVRTARTTSAAPAASTARAAARAVVRSAPIAAAPATAPDGAMALPFTGGHVDSLLPSGVLLLLGGVVLTLVGRPRRSGTAA